MPATCCQPGFTTMFERVKIANVIKVIGMQIFSASYIVFRKDAFAMRAQSLAATSQARLLLGPANVVRMTLRWWVRRSSATITGARWTNCCRPSCVGCCPS